MDVIHLQKAFAFIAKGLIEKEAILKTEPNRYPYSKNLQRGINMFLSACVIMGKQTYDIFNFADETNFLTKYACKPIREWFVNWDEQSMEFHDIAKQAFYSYEAFVYKRKGESYSVSQECEEYLSVQESNIIEGTDEHALYEKIIQLSQDDYCDVRKYIIEHPIISIAEHRELRSRYASNVIVRDSIELAYEIFEGEGSICPNCGWTMQVNSYGYTCVSEHCCEHMPKVTDEMIVDGNKETVYRLKKGVMRYFAIPGKLELEIAKYCEKKKLKYKLWPLKDTFDIEICFGDGDTWEIDAKAYHNPISLCEKIKKDGGFPRGEYAKGYYVVPDECTRYKNNYTSVVNNMLVKQPNVKCVTLSAIKKSIGRKERECNA